MSSPAPRGEAAVVESESARTVVVALLANLGIAVAKVVAAVISGSGAMLAEAFHAFADTGNQVLLLVAQRRGARPPDHTHPLGHGREAYFWALIAALSVFVTGALLSLRQGIEELVAGASMSSYRLAYVVLAVSLCLEIVSLSRAYRQLRKEAEELDREFLDHLDVSSDPVARAVFAEDAAAVAGNVVAAAGIALHQATGSVVPDAVAAIAIGLVLGWVAYELASRNRDFLVGRQVSSGLRGRVQEVIAAQSGVRAVEELVVTILGPRQVWVLARVDVDDGLDGAQVKELVRATSAAVERASPFIERVDICL